MKSLETKLAGKKQRPYCHRRRNLAKMEHEPAATQQPLLSSSRPKSLRPQSSFFGLRSLKPLPKPSRIAQ